MGIIDKATALRPVGRRTYQPDLKDEQTTRRLVRHEERAPMSTDAEQLADQLIQVLNDADVRAQLANSGPSAAGVYVFGDDPKRPATMLAVLTSTERPKYTWGEFYDHELPIETPVPQVAAAIVNTLESTPEGSS
ncbi:hypothetical protein ABEG17_01705 [Pedococcus sp. KACC 23699]|uniref:Uncharacterized protein n=1 Tax=Pedococcus sp. KACC 23699 TaxID=3149228 RepID=A0AAU7JUE1_9MICO